MRTAALTVLALVLVTLLGGGAFVWSGAFDVAADVPHSAPVFALLNYARVRSIKVHAAGLHPPAGWDAQPGVIMAVGHFHEHCALCHGAPGADEGPIGDGMYPQPPNLKLVSQRFTPGELFWILKHGIKMSGMPSMADDGDAMLWSTVAFLEKLPTLPDGAYDDLWHAAQASDATNADAKNADATGMGGMKMDGMSPAAPTPSPENPKPQ